MGKDNENAARLAVDELNSQNLEIGGAKVKFELLAEDDQADPKQGTIVAQKLVDAKVNGVMNSSAWRVIMTETRTPCAVHARIKSAAL